VGDCRIFIDGVEFGAGECFTDECADSKRPGGFVELSKPISITLTFVADQRLDNPAKVADNSAGPRNRWGRLK
jgi:hypothetical protein